MFACTFKLTTSTSKQHTVKKCAQSKRRTAGWPCCATDSVYGLTTFTEYVGVVLTYVLAHAQNVFGITRACPASLTSFALVIWSLLCTSRHDSTHDNNLKSHVTITGQWCIRQEYASSSFDHVMPLTATGNCSTYAHLIQRHESIFPPIGMSLR